MQTTSACRGGLETDLAPCAVSVFPKSGQRWGQQLCGATLPRHPLVVLVHRRRRGIEIASGTCLSTALLGHTRWRTRGDPGNNANNHPIRAGDIVGTHNGTLYNADALFRRLRLPRFAEVDSEVIFRMAQRCTTEGKINVPNWQLR